MMTSIDQVVNRLKEQNINVTKVLSRAELRKRLAKVKENKKIKITG